MPQRSDFAAAMAAISPSIVFYYGGTDQTQSLARFDVAVIEPGHGFVPAGRDWNTCWLAYISVGEALEAAPYFDAIPQGLLIGRNSAWHSRIIDQDAPSWPDFLARQIAQPLWRRGYQGFFLDTLDSYLLISGDQGRRERQRQGLLHAILGLREAFPNAVLIMNRGFELLPELHTDIDAVAFESLYQGWNQTAGKYIEIHPDDRTWLLGQAATARAHGLPVISIDYCPPEASGRARATRKRILKHGLVPYVGDSYLQTIPTSPLPGESI